MFQMSRWLISGVGCRARQMFRNMTDSSMRKQAIASSSSNSIENQSSNQSSNSSSSNDGTKFYNDKYIEERINNLFNIILADINFSQQYNHERNKPNAIIYKDPYNSKDQILQDLLMANTEIHKNYNIQDLIEEEFQLEISDKEFEQFKTLNDITKYVARRLDVRNQLMTQHRTEYAYNVYWY